jgi:hypothetical protein
MRHWNGPEEGHESGATIEKLKVTTSPGLTGRGTAVWEVPQKELPDARKYVPGVQTVVPVFFIVTETGAAPPALKEPGTD